MKKAAILAAGDSTRMLPLSANMPKHLLPIGGRPLIFQTLDRLREIGIEETLVIYGYQGDKMRDAIDKDLVDIGNVMNQNWDAQKNLHPLMINEQIMKAEKIAKKYNALGFKCNGAGGGGSATILANSEHILSFKNELLKEGYNILPCKLCFDGVFSYIK